MSDSSSLDYEPGILRVLQSKSETKAFYNKIAHVYDLLAEHSERPMREAGLKMLAAAPRRARTGDRLWNRPYSGRTCQGGWPSGKGLRD